MTEPRIVRVEWQMPRAKPAGFVDPMPPAGFADLMPTVVATFDDGARSERGVLSGALALDRLAMGLAGAVTESPAQLRLGITSTAAAALAIGWLLAGRLNRAQRWTEVGRRRLEDTLGPALRETLRAAEAT